MNRVNVAAVDRLMSPLFQRVFWLALLLVILPRSANAVLPIERWQTDSGVPVYFIHAPDIPMLDVSVRFDAGARLDTRERSGVAILTTSLLDAGAGPFDEQQLADQFAQIGADRGAWSGNDSASVSVRTLSSASELDAAIQLIRIMLTKPHFDPAVVKREKQRLVQRIRDALTRPASNAYRLFDRATYPDHPYGFELSEQSVQRITQADLLAFHRRYFVQKRASIAIIGDVTRDKAMLIARSLMADLPRGIAGNSLPDVPLLASAQLSVQEHDSAQSHILIGAPLLARGDPDRFALAVGNYILGSGGFVSRLYREVRERRGLSYSVGSSISARDQFGPFVISLQTKPEQAQQALQVVTDVLFDLVEKGPSPKEVAEAKSSLIGGFAMNTDSNGELLGQLARMAYDRLPVDYLANWPARIDALTHADIVDVLRRRLHPDRLATIVVGRNVANIQLAKPSRSITSTTQTK